MTAFNQSKVVKRNKPFVRRKRRRREMNMSRLMDVRFWSTNEIKSFLVIYVDGKYFNIFIQHNINGKRFEFITMELLKHCNIPSGDVQNIINGRDFFVDWLSLYIFCNDFKTLNFFMIHAVNE